MERSKIGWWNSASSSLRQLRGGIGAVLCASLALMGSEALAADRQILKLDEITVADFYALYLSKGGTERGLMTVLTHDARDHGDEFTRVELRQARKRLVFEKAAEYKSGGSVHFEITGQAFRLSEYNFDYHYFRACTRKSFVVSRAHPIVTAHRGRKPGIKVSWDRKIGNPTNGCITLPMASTAEARAFKQRYAHQTLTMAYHCPLGRFINAISGECHPWNIRIFDQGGTLIYTLRWYEGRGWVKENLVKGR